MTSEKKTQVLSVHRITNIKIYLAFLFFAFSGNTLLKATIPIDQLVLQVADSLIQHHQAYGKAANLLTQLVAGKDAKTVDPKILKRLAHIQLENENYDKAKYHLEQIQETPLYQHDSDFRYSTEKLKIHLYLMTDQHDLLIIATNQLIINEKKASNSPARLSYLYHTLATGYYFLRLKKAKVYFQESIDYSHKNNSVNFGGYNNLIDIYIENHNYEEAKKYLDLLIAYSNKENKPYQYISAKRKESHLLAQIGRGEQAKRILEECRRLSHQHNIPIPPSSLIYDSYAHQASNQIDSAIFYAETVLEYAIEKNELDFIEVCRTHLFKLYTEAEYFEKAVRIQSQIDSANLASNRIAQIENIAFLDKPEKEPAGTMTFGLFILIFGIILSLFLGAYYSIQNASQKSEVPSPRNQELLQQLRTKNELLTRKELAFQQNLNFLKQLKVDIRQLNHDKPKLAKNVNLLIHKVNGSMQFQYKWEELSKYFAELYPTFFSHLREKYPDLTSSEVRHCIFLKLNLTIDEVAQILNIEPTSVSSARYRLKKKIDIDSLMELKEENNSVKHLPKSSDFLSPWNNGIPKNNYIKKRI